MKIFCAYNCLLFSLLIAFCFEQNLFVNARSGSENEGNDDDDDNQHHSSNGNGGNNGQRQSRRRSHRPPPHADDADAGPSERSNRRRSHRPSPDDDGTSLSYLSNPLHFFRT